MAGDISDDDGQRGSGEPAPHETQQGADTPVHGASPADGNVADPHRAPAGHRSAGPSSSNPPAAGDDLDAIVARFLSPSIAVGDLAEVRRAVLGVRPGASVEVRIDYVATVRERSLVIEVGSESSCRTRGRRWTIPEVAP